MILPSPIYADFVLPALVNWQKAGLKTALLTLIGSNGASPRPIGSQLAVSETGESLGLITGGCAEGALVHDALSAMDEGRNRIELYGEGSRFKDITLPCGSGIRVFIDVQTRIADLEAVITSRASRRPGLMRIEPADEAPYLRRYLPMCRLVVVGRGPILVALAQIAPLMEVELVIYTPDDAVHDLPANIARLALCSPDDFDAGQLDCYSALILVTHDHDWEPSILRAGLDTDAFFIGALGSRRAHARRLEALAALGASQSSLARVHGPVGLDIGAASPPEIALAIMAQVIQHWRGFAQ